MLIITRRAGEKIRVGDDVCIEVMGVTGSTVRDRTANQRPRGASSACCGNKRGASGSGPGRHRHNLISEISTLSAPGGSLVIHTR